MKKNYFTKGVFLFLAILVLGCSYQKLSAQDFSAIDTHAKSTSGSESKSVENLANYLNKPTKSDLDKVRAYYIWLTHNIAYDTKAFFSGSSSQGSTIDETLQKKKAVCQGYSELFMALCRYSQIPCFLVDGYSKGFGYKPGKKFVQSDHAWNAVFVDNKWQLIDATWGAGYMDENLKFKKLFTNEYFLASPDEFIKKHLPSDPMWQLLTHPVTMDCYIKDEVEFQKCYTANQAVFSFTDTIQEFLKLSPEMQQVVSAERAFAFYPENADAPGYAYLNLAFEYSKGLEELYNKKDYEKVLSQSQKALELNEKALVYLKKSKSPNGKSAANICRQNIISLKESIKSLKNFIK